MASIHKCHNSPYYYCAYTLADGARKFRSTKKKRESEAWKVCQQWAEAAVEAGTDSRDLEILNEMRTARGRKPMQLPTIREYLQTWLENQKLHLAASTHTRYGSSIRKLVTFLGTEADHELQTLTGEQIEKFILSEKEAGLAPKSLNLDLKAIHAALGKAFKRQHVKINVAGTVDPQPSSTAEKRAFTLKHVRQLLNTADDDEWYGLIYVGYYTGLRLGDVSHLRWDNVDMREKLLTVVPDKRETRRHRPPLEVPIHPHLLNWFKVWRTNAITNEMPFVFPTLSQKKIEGDKGLSNTFTRLITTAGIDNLTVREKVSGSTRSRSVRAYGFHSLRSTFNTELKNVGVGVEDRMKLSDHSTPEMNLRYTKSELSRLHGEIGKLPKL